MINDAPVLRVYEMGDDSLSLLGILQDYTSIVYNPIFDDVGTFTLKMPFSKVYFSMFMSSEGSEKVLYIEDGIVGICQKISCELTTKSNTLKIQGMLGEGFLENSILHEFDYLRDTEPPESEEYYTIQHHIQAALQNSNLLRGTLWGALNFVSITVNSSFVPNNDVLAGRSTFGEFIRTLCKSCNKGYKVRMNLQTGKLDFSLSDYTDRGESSEHPIYISRELISLGDSKFTINSQPYKNRLMVWAEFDVNGTPSTASMEINYDESGKQPHSKKEIRADYIKVDIASESPIADLSDAYARLNAQGKQALYEAAYIKSYDAEVKGDQSNSVYRFNQDYFLGDIIAVRDSDIGLSVDVKMLEYTKTIDLKGSHFDPVFGVSQPTLNRVLKQQKIIR